MENMNYNELVILKMSEKEMLRGILLLLLTEQVKSQ